MNVNPDAELMYKKGMEDFAALNAMLDHVDISNEIFGFHAQQAVEKFLKAWLWCVGVAPPKKHDLRLLYILLKDNGANVPPPFEGLIDLTDFATVFRYETCEEIDIDRQTVLERVHECSTHVQSIVYGQSL